MVRELQLMRWKINMMPWKTLIFATLAVAATDPTVSSFKQAAAHIPESLVAKGYSSFGTLKLEPFLHSMNGVEVKSTGWIDRPQDSVDGETFSRSSAEWNLDANGKAHIQLNRALWAKTDPDMQLVVGLHEYLGAEGFYDRNYEVSSALWALSVPQATYFTPEDKAAITSRIGVTARSGGIVGIGGGGDEAGANTKVSALRRDLDRLADANGNEEHRAVVANIQEDLAIQSEVKRVGDSDKGLLYDHVAPLGVASASLTVTTCQQVLRLPEADQAAVFRDLATSNPAAAQKLGGESGLLEWCRDYVSGRSP